MFHPTYPNFRATLEFTIVAMINAKKTSTYAIVPFVGIRCIAAAGIVVFHEYWHCGDKAVMYIVPPTNFCCPSFLGFIFHGVCNYLWRYAAPSLILFKPLLATDPAAYSRIKIA